MKRTFLIGIIIIITNQLPAQKYITAAGVRFSNEGFGLSLQQRIFEHTTIEAIGQINFKEVSATAMIEHHNNLLFTKSLNMYGGCLLYTSPSPRDRTRSRMPYSA